MPLSAEELAYELYSRQGYLVVNWPVVPMGKTSPVMRSRSGMINIPIRVIGPATREEFFKQAGLAAEITGTSVGTVLRFDLRFDHFYRVEALD